LLVGLGIAMIALSLVAPELPDRRAGHGKDSHG
jgi:hypothetical protein